MNDLSLKVHDIDAVVKRFKTDLHNTVGLIQEPKKLKESVKQIYVKYVSDDSVSSPILLVLFLDPAEVFPLESQNKFASSSQSPYHHSNAMITTKRNVVHLFMIKATSTAYCVNNLSNFIAICKVDYFGR